MVDTYNFEYYPVISNNILNNDYSSIFEYIINRYYNNDIINYGKIFVPDSDIKLSIGDFLRSITCNLYDCNVIIVNNEYFIFKCIDLYFYITWVLKNHIYQFNILHGSDYSIDEYGVHVFFQEEDADTVINDDDESNGENEDDSWWYFFE